MAGLISMPLPKTTKVGKIVSFLKRKGERKRPQKQIVAIALAQARKSGAKIPKKGNPHSLKNRKKKTLGGRTITYE